MGRLYIRMKEYLECICVLWPSGRCRGWKSGHDTSKKKKSVSLLVPRWRSKSNAGVLAAFWVCTSRELCVAREWIIWHGCWVSMSLCNKQEIMLLVHCLIGRHPAAWRQGGGAYLHSGVTLGGANVRERLVQSNRKGCVHQMPFGNEERRWWNPVWK